MKTKEFNALLSNERVEGAGARRVRALCPAACGYHGFPTAETANIIIELFYCSSLHYFPIAKKIQLQIPFGHY